MHVLISVASSQASLSFQVQTHKIREAILCIESYIECLYYLGAPMHAMSRVNKQLFTIYIAYIVSIKLLTDHHKLLTCKHVHYTKICTESIFSSKCIP